MKNLFKMHWWEILIVTLITLIVTVGVLSMFNSCTKPDEIEIYRVKTDGTHSINRGLVFEYTFLKFYFTIDDSWYWQDGEVKAKVYGLAFGTEIDSPKHNSVRLATKVINGEVHLYMFCHVDKSDPITYDFGVFEKGKHYCELGYDHIEDYFYMRLDGDYQKVQRSHTDKQSILCYPWKGFNTLVDWTVKIERVQ